MPTCQNIGSFNIIFPVLILNLKPIKLPADHSDLEGLGYPQNQEG